MRGSAVLACAPGEHHDIGLLMLAVMLRADGWRVEFLGADTPVDAARGVRGADRRRDALPQRRRGPSRSTLLRAALPAVEPAGPMMIVVGGAAVTPRSPRELEATYADAQLDVAVERLRKFAAR